MSTYILMKKRFMGVCAHMPETYKNLGLCFGWIPDNFYYGPYNWHL